MFIALCWVKWRKQSDNCGRRGCSDVWKSHQNKLVQCVYTAWVKLDKKLFFFSAAQCALVFLHIHLHSHYNVHTRRYEWWAREDNTISSASLLFCYEKSTECVSRAAHIYEWFCQLHCDCHDNWAKLSRTLGNVSRKTEKNARSNFFGINFHPPEQPPLDWLIFEEIRFLLDEWVSVVMP